MTMLDDAMTLMRLLDMEPYPWQREFFELYCLEPYVHQQIHWERVLHDLDRLAGGGWRNGKTTALAIWLAVDPYLIDWERRSTWVSDHWPTRQAAERLVRLAMEYKRRWQEFGRDRTWLLKYVEKRVPDFLTKEVQDEEV